MIIRDYNKRDETGWVRCRALAFLQMAYFDNVLTKKGHYQNPSIELVSEHDGQIVGLNDVEYAEKQTVCSRGEGLGGFGISPSILIFTDKGLDSNHSLQLKIERRN